MSQELLEVEIAILSYCLNFEWVFPIAKETIKNKNYFSKDIHKKLWETILTLNNLGEVIDRLTVMFRAGFGDVDLNVYLNHLDDRTLMSPKEPTTPCEEQIKAYCKILEKEFNEKYSIAEFLAAAQEIKLKSKTPEAALNELAAKGALLGSNEKPKYTEAQFRDDLLHGLDQSGNMLWKIGEMDKLAGPLKRGSILIIGARPSHGKTAMILQIAENLTEQRKRVFLMSTEMGEQILLYRRMARMSGIKISELERGLENHQSWNAPGFKDYAIEAFADISEHNNFLVVEEAAGMSGEEIVARIKAAHKKFGMDVFILDHFHDINHAGKFDKRKSMEEALNSIGATCRSLGITAIIAAQLNRGSEHREDNEPGLSDLRECGKLEEIATNVLLLHWPFKKHLDTNRKQPFVILNAKNRNGIIGKIYLNFDAEHFNFHGSYTPEEWREANKAGGLR